VDVRLAYDIASWRCIRRPANSVWVNAQRHKKFGCKDLADSVPDTLDPEIIAKRGLTMARVTVEDCIDKVENRFELVLLASHRARMIAGGASLTVDRDRDKNPVVALREIADQHLTPDDLKEDLIHSMQKYVEVDEPEAEPVALLGNDSDEGITFDRMSEEDLLRGLEGLVPPADNGSDDEE